MDISISDFHTSFYIPEIQNIPFQLPHVCILRENHCGNTHPEAFKCCREYQYVLCHRDYAYRVVASFAQQIRLEYYGGNQSAYIGLISNWHFSAPTHTEAEAAKMTQARTRHSMFY